MSDFLRELSLNHCALCGLKVFFTTEVTKNYLKGHEV